MNGPGKVISLFQSRLETTERCLLSPRDQSLPCCPVVPASQLSGPSCFLAVAYAFDRFLTILQLPAYTIFGKTAAPTLLIFNRVPSIPPLARKTRHFRYGHLTESTAPVYVACIADASHSIYQNFCGTVTAWLML